MTKVLMKGNEAVVHGALLAGCRCFFGYPITPSTEGAELMAQLLPRLDGAFVQAVSEVATVNMMYGCGGAGLRAMTFTSSPGFSLMLEGISYLVGAELPGVFVNVMRGGPGLGNIAPEQADYFQITKGGGHGNYRLITLAPNGAQEMCDLTMKAFDLSDKYRNPACIMADGITGQMMEVVEIPVARPLEFDHSGWCVDGVCCESACEDRCHACNLDGSAGSCAPLDRGVDPSLECAGAEVCDGAGGCVLPDGQFASITRPKE